MQMAVADFARHVVGMDGANSTEFDPETPYPVIDLLPEQKEVADMGGTMRLGADPVKLHAGHAARELYGEAVIYERHRHRYEVNNFLRKRLEAAGLVISGTSPDERLVEIIEIPDHPFFVASQFHPEFKSRPERPAPLFRDFVAAALARARERRPRRDRRRTQPRPARDVRPASEAEKARLAETFAELCRIPSPFGHERECADRVLAELRGMGRRRPRRTPRGNLLARLPGRVATRTVLLCAHLDTVETEAPIEPVLVDGGWENEHDGILGADNKAALAVMLEVARRASRRGLARSGIELLFTVSEENALAGAKAFDASRLRSDFGYVFDHATAIGEVVVASPTYFRLRGRLPRQGRARRHPARGRPQRDRSPRRARSPPCRSAGSTTETTANVGSVHGGVGVHQRRPRALPAARRDALARPCPRRGVGRRAWSTRCTTAPRGPNATSTSSPRSCSPATACAPGAPELAAAEAALRACGYEPRRIRPAAGRTPTRSQAAGFPCVNLANGTERNHEPTERVSVAALEGMLDVALALLDEAAAV